MSDSSPSHSTGVIVALSQAEIADYSADLLASLKKMAVAGDMPLFAHLLDLARIEALGFL